MFGPRRLYRLLDRVFDLQQRLGGQAEAGQSVQDGDRELWGRVVEFAVGGGGGSGLFMVTRLRSDMPHDEREPVQKKV